ncbi:TPA: structural protein 3 family protein [Acinetobacter baumannii]|nr:structural protein 3 family protein [Acinetobacter baumannii]HDR2013459.1 structural protein 3 family protein [Acinetobacter baumannii]
MANVKTQKTQLFTVLNGQVVRFVCSKRIDLGQDSFQKIDVTCLDAESKQYVRGMRDPGEGAVEIDYDDTNTSHDKLIEIAESGEILEWHVGSGHASTEPTYDATTGIDLPKDRMWWSFKGYINPTAPNAFEVDSVVGYSFTLIRNSGVTSIKRTVAP